MERGSLVVCPQLINVEKLKQQEKQEIEVEDFDFPGFEFFLAGPCRCAALPWPGLAPGVALLLVLLSIPAVPIYYTDGAGD